jgi:hypothetical protein
LKKLSLGDWTQFAEIAGTIGVIVSLLFVAHSIDENTRRASAQISDGTYDALRVATVLTIEHPRLLSLTMTPRVELDGLQGDDRALYKEWLTLHLDEWERLYARQQNELISRENLAGWNDYFSMWFERQVTPDIWREIRWRHTTGEFREIRDRQVASWSTAD